jgi:transcriptional regulator with XRE-family HTH domain
MTREAMAFDAGITIGSLAQIELGKGSPSWDSFRRIAAALDLSIGQLATAIEAAEGPHAHCSEKQLLPA